MIFYLIFYCEIFLSLISKLHGESNFSGTENGSHLCDRQCNNKTIPMTCEYKWKIEWYSVLSKACLDCPLNITNCLRSDCVAANGVPRSIITVNRQLPGPLINVCQGDTIKIQLTNGLHMTEGTSLHWHGISQRGFPSTPYMDGVSMISQCPIIANTYFEYKFNAYDHGTHLWHAHSGIQRADGAFGPLIVRQYDEKNSLLNLYDYDLVEHIITLNDWINETSISKFISHHHNEGNNKPTSILINGKGAFNKFVSADGTYMTPRAQFLVKKGHKYRFRVINAGFLYCPIQFSIDSHNLTIISSDGRLVEPVEVQNFFIYAGERYDFILNANQSINNYLIRTRGYADCHVNHVFEVGILRYADAKSRLQDIESQMFEDLDYHSLIGSGLQFNPWNTKITEANNNSYIVVDQLRAIIDEDTQRFFEAIKTTNVKKFYLGMDFNKINNEEFYNAEFYSLNLTMSLGRNPLYTPQINDISMHLPSTPILYHWDYIPKTSICNHLNKTEACPNSDAYCSCIYTLEFSIGDVVEFVVVDKGFTFQSNHPMHLHGHSFAVLAVNKLNTSINLADVISMDKNGLLQRNLDKPVIKDTVTVPVGGYTIIRFVANNPGSWLFHCHLDFHSEIGMALIVKVGNVTDLPPEPSKWPHCGNYKLQDSSSGTISNKIGSRVKTFFILIFLQFL